MGMDIFLETDNYDALDEIDAQELMELDKLSRNFCNLMFRRHVIAEEEESELDQVGKLTDTDIEPLYEMADYPGGEALEYALAEAETEEEEAEITAEFEEMRESMAGNLDSVLNTVSSLIEKLNNVADLPAKLAPTEFDSLGNAYYFAKFSESPDESFGQDLRTLKRFLEMAKEKGTTTVWFHFG